MRIGEKPPTTSSGDALELVTAAERRGLTLAAGHTYACMVQAYEDLSTRLRARREAIAAAKKPLAAQKKTESLKR